MARGNKREAPLIVEKSRVKCPCGDLFETKKDLTMSQFEAKLEEFYERHSPCLVKNELPFADDIPPPMKDVTPPKSGKTTRPASTALIVKGPSGVAAR